MCCWMRCNGLIAYPLLLEPQYDRKIWGGRRLETVLGKALPGPELIGESLESGDDAVVSNGQFAGRMLKELVELDGCGLLGRHGLAASEPFCDFPLLVKFIDATAVLSLQVHPDDEGARERGKRGKTEAWYIVQAEPGASLITGMSRMTDSDEVRDSIQDGSFEELLERRIVSGGECLVVPAGTVHAIGAGVLLYEVQQNCDLTYRLYDWGRVDAQGNPRDLHLEDALRSLRSERHALPVSPLRIDDWREMLAACRYFALERWSIAGGCSFIRSSDASFRLVSCIAGELSLHAPDSEPVDLATGRTALLPADLLGLRIEGNGTLLCSYVPDLDVDVVQPLLAAGHSLAELATLAGDTGDLSATR